MAEARKRLVHVWALAGGGGRPVRGSESTNAMSHRDRTAGKGKEFTRQDRGVLFLFKPHFPAYSGNQVKSLNVSHGAASVALRKPSHAVEKISSSLSLVLSLV